MFYNSYTEEIYNKLNKIPEKAFKEYKTSQLIYNELCKMGYEIYKNIGGTGIVAKLDSGNSGPIVGVRADMDALEYKINGKKQYIHACGHDANCAMVLGMGKEIIEQGIKKGKLILIFQPAEEIMAGAKKIIESGYIDELEEIIGIHLRPEKEAKLGEATPALIHSAAKTLKVKIVGKSAHASRPHLGVNAIDIGVSLINSINNIRMNPKNNYSIKATQFITSNNSSNIIPDLVNITLDLRAETNEVMEKLYSKAEKLIINIPKVMGAKGEIVDKKECPAAKYDDNLVSIAKEAITKVLGKVLPSIYTYGGEDFHYYTKELKLKSTYIGIGANLKMGLHHPKMNFDIRALNKGKEVLKEIILARLI
ncbi:amidohydrolase [Thermohalobacter berrensis]|uniref:Peptidase M20 n=1 Tax=Thermohalobacter berrensis TaxID=99594 RepID=A0A419T8R6_9FIRM|nr:amidohydrolase [Thermohalobacter berrensis]RKD33861.1 peptidase M20 [Thermohalobacter berrensis]